MEVNRSDGIGFFTVLFFIFLILKLTKTINWSWVWVFSPLWGPFVLIIVIGIIMLLVESFKKD